MQVIFVCPTCTSYLTAEETEKPICRPCNRRYLRQKAYTNCMESTVEVSRKNYVVKHSIEAAQDITNINELVKNKLQETPELTEAEIEMWQKINDSHLFGRKRTPDPTEEEISDWQYYHKLFSEIDFERVKKEYKIHILREEPPYWWIELDSCDEDFAKTYGYIPDWMKNTWEWFNLKEFTEWMNEGKDNSTREGQ